MLCVAQLRGAAYKLSQSLDYISKIAITMIFRGYLKDFSKFLKNDWCTSLSNWVKYWCSSLLTRMSSNYGIKSKIMNNWSVLMAPKAF